MITTTYFNTVQNTLVYRYINNKNLYKIFHIISTSFSGIPRLLVKKATKDTASLYISEGIKFLLRHLYGPDFFIFST